MSADAGRPRLLLLRWTRPGLAPFLRDQLDEQTRCLREGFEVVEVEGGGDYDQLCDTHEPDLVLLESGVYVGPRRLTNTDTHPDVPRAGFLNADAFDPVRAVFVADMARWGVPTWFTVSTTMAAYAPELAERLLCWPNFVDPDAFASPTPMAERVVPVLLTGSQARHYPWRNRVNRVLAQHHPVLAVPHFGWRDDAGTRRMPVGADYAKLLGAAQFAPSCGSFTRDFVRKHVEIPAAGTALVAQDTPAMAAAGYRDLVNCVLADEHDVLDKVGDLLADPDRLAEVAAAGTALVRARHTAAQRRQVREWYDLVAAGVPPERITQADPFASLTHDGARPPAPTSQAEDRVQLARGWAAVDAGREEAAVRAFTAASSYQYLAESVVGQAVVDLGAGRAAAALSGLDALVGRMVSLYDAPAPDPVVAAVRAWALLCLDGPTAAARSLAAHPQLEHPELRRTRRALAWLGAGVADPVEAARPSVAGLPGLDAQAWVERLAGLLRRHARTEEADRLAGLAALPEAGWPVGRSDPPAPPTPQEPRGRQAAGRARAGASRLAGTLGEQAREAARRRVGERWLEAVAEVAERHQLDRVVLVSASRWSLRRRALEAAASRNPTQPVLERRGRAAGALVPAGERVLVYLAGPTLDGAGPGLTPRTADLVGAEVVVVDGTAHPAAVRLVTELERTGRFELVAQGAQAGGYVVLRHEAGVAR